MALSRSLATTAVICCLAASTTAFAQKDERSIEDSIRSIEKLGREAMRLKEESRWKEYRSAIAEADAIHQQASNALTEERKSLDGAQRKLDGAINQFERPQIMVQAILAEATDLDDAVLKAACTRVNAESVDGDPARNIEPSIYSMSSDQAGKLLAAIEKRRPIQVISRPSILAIDGQIAEVTVGQQVKTQTAALNEQGETQYKPGVENVGLMVTLTPTIEDARQTRIALTVKNSSLTGQAIVIGTKANGEVITSPMISSEKMETTLKSTDGRTILVALKSIKVRTSASASPRSALKALAPAWTDEPTKTTLVLLTPRVVERTADAGDILHH